MVKDLRRQITRRDFIKRQKEKSRVQRKGRKKFKALIGRASIRVVIRESAAGRKYMVMKYRKSTTGELKTYKVAPYSFRYKNSAHGRRKFLFAYDFKDKHIKGFHLRNVRSVERTISTFTPKWPVELTL